MTASMAGHWIQALHGEEGHAPDDECREDDAPPGRRRKGKAAGAGAPGAPGAMGALAAVGHLAA